MAVWNNFLALFQFHRLFIGENTMVILCTLHYPENSFLMRHLSLQHSTERCSISLTSKANVKCIELYSLLVCSRYRKGFSYSVVQQFSSPEQFHIWNNIVFLHFHKAVIVLVFLICRVVAFVLMEAVVVDR